MQSLGKERGDFRLRARAAGAFAAHQVIATLGVMVATPAALALSTPVLRLLGLPLSVTRSDQILTGMHCFPAQAATGFLLGWLLVRRTGHRSAQWVWALPALLVLLLVVTNHHVLDFEPASVVLPTFALSHFFGSGCSPRNRCFDQVVVTLPLYAAVAYSLGALTARRLGLRRWGGGDLPPQTLAGGDVRRLAVILAAATAIVTFLLFGLAVAVGPSAPRLAWLATLVVAPAAVAAGWVFRQLRNRLQRWEAAAVSILFAVLSPLCATAAMPLPSEAGANALPLRKSISLIGAFFGVAAAIWLATLTSSLVILWLAHRPRRARAA